MSRTLTKDEATRLAYHRTIESLEKAGHALIRQACDMRFSCETIVDVERWHLATGIGDCINDLRSAERAQTRFTTLLEFKLGMIE